MSNRIIEKLLNGSEVEWKPLGDVSSIKTGQAISKSIISNNIGNYPVINSGKEPLGYINQYNTENDPIGITTRGAGVGSITWQDGRYFRGNLNYSVTVKNNKELNVRFLYHSLLFMQKEIHSLCTFTGIPALNSSELKKLEIPIPPLEAQEKIVKTLDKFTELEATLEATLEAELALRKKQYQYYRETLLTFPQDLDRGYNEITKALYHNTPMVFKALGEMGELIRGNGLQKKDFTETGVPAIHYGQIYTYYGTFADKTKSFVSAELAKKLKKAQKGDVLIAGTSENVEDVMKPLGWLGDDIVFSGDMFAFRPNKNLDTKYLTYLLQTEHFAKYKEKYAQGTKVIRLNSANLLKYEIPVPELFEQQKIVNILDKFDCLTNSISEGLPKEIALRRKQYEYYREQLLDFSKS